MSRQSVTRRGLGHRYHRLFAAATISNLGDGVFVVALPLVAADLTRDPTAIAGVALATSLPWLLFALVAGALVDRWDRRLVMVGADTIRALLVALLAAAVVTDSHSLTLLYTIGFGLGTAETMFDNASQTILPSIIDDHRDLPRANGRLFASETITNQFVGPPLGGFLVAAAAAVPFWLDAASFLAAAALVASIPGRFRAPAADTSVRGRTSLRSEIAEGVRWLWGHRLLRDLAILLSLMNLWASAGFAVMVLFAQEELGLGELGFGLLMTGPAIGSVVGGIAAGRVTERVGSGPVLIFGCFGVAGGLLLVGFVSNALLAASLLALFGMAGVGWNVVTVSLRQSIIPDELLGRVNSVYRFLGWGGMPIGAVVGGVLAQWLGLRAPFLVGGLVLIAASAVFAPGLTTARVEAALRAAKVRRDEPAETRG